MNYYTGCDVHKRTTTIQHMDEEGSLGLSMTIPTDKASIRKFLDQLDDPTSITFEAGRNWWWIHQFFSQHPQVTQVKVVDPRRARILASELSVQSGYGRAKNDEIDSEMLAELTRRDLAPAINVPTVEQLEKRTFCRHRFGLVINRTRAKNIIHAFMAMHGTSARICDLTDDLSIRNQVYKSIPDYISFIIDQLLSQVQLFDKQIFHCEKQINSLLPESHPQMKLLMSAPGIGIVLARIIFTEILNIAYFKEPKYLVSYSGLAPIDNESAGRKGRIRLNRYCNYYLKYAFVEAAHNGSDFKKYRRKYELDVKKHGKILAKINLARRIVKAVYWMLTRQQLYKM